MPPPVLESQLSCEFPKTTLDFNAFNRTCGVFQCRIDISNCIWWLNFCSTFFSQEKLPFAEYSTKIYFIKQQKCKMLSIIQLFLFFSLRFGCVPRGRNHFNVWRLGITAETWEKKKEAAWFPKCGNEPTPCTWQDHTVEKNSCSCDPPAGQVYFVTSQNKTTMHLQRNNNQWMSHGEGQNTLKSCSGKIPTSCVTLVNNG